MKSFNKFMFFAFTLTVLITAPYLNVSAIEMKDSMMKKDQMMKKDHMDSPHKQMKMGIADHDIQCKADYKLVFKSTDWSSACVKHSSVVSLVQRGWAASEEEMMSMEKEMMNDESMMKDESMMEDKEHMGEKSMMTNSVGGVDISMASPVKVHLTQLLQL